MCCAGAAKTARTATRRRRKNRRYDMNRADNLRNKLYRLLANHPYATVRTECDRIDRQLRELNTQEVKKPKK